MEATLDFEWSDAQSDLIDVVREVAEEQADWSEYLRVHDVVAVEHGAAWKTLVDEVGIRGLTFSEADGGAGEPWRTTAAIVHALAVQTAAVPVFGQLGLVEAALGWISRHDLIDEYLEGRTVFTVGVPEGQPSHDFSPVVRLHEGRLFGVLRGVPHPQGADTILLLAQERGEARIVRVDVDESAVESVRGLDAGRPLADMEFDGAAGTVILSDAQQSLGTWRHVLQVAEVLVAVEQAAIAGYVLDQAVKYSTERKQFGKPINANQSIRHTLAEMWIRAGEAQSAAFYAIHCLDDETEDLPVAICLARAYNAEAARKNAEAAVQIHGGIGFSWENPLHLGLKRAIADSLWLDSPTGYRSAMRRLVNI